MGYYTNYEIEFSTKIKWDGLNEFNVECLYLRDLELPRLILSIYSTNSIENVLQSLLKKYNTIMRYRIYNTQEWILY